jgi:hypothetical protein
MSTYSEDINYPCAVAKVVTYSIPSEDAAEFSALPAEVQVDVLEKLSAMERIASADSILSGARSIAAMSGGKRGWSVGRLRTQFACYSRSGDWHTLLNAAKAGPAHYRSGGSVENLPVLCNAAFAEYVRSEIELCQRNNKQAHRNIIARWNRWRAGDLKSAIPGYKVCPPVGENGLFPDGWSYDNMIARLKPDRADLARARQGQRAASQYRPAVLTSRVGLRVGEFIQFDDVEFDLRINFPGQLSAMRPRGFFSIDVASAFDTGMSWKPTLWDEVEEKKKTLTEQDFLWFVVNHLLDCGYRADERGTTLIWEHGTATVRDRNFIEKLMSLTGGKVRPAVSGILGAEQMAGMFEGGGRGNFRFKSLREGAFSLLHNYFQCLPGQVGRNRESSPEQLHGLERYNSQLLKVVPTLPADRAALLQFPVLTWDEFIDKAQHLLREISDRTDHEIEGWDACRNIAYQWRLAAGQEWQSDEAYAALPEASRQALSVLFSQMPDLRQPRRLSPRQVWHRNASQLTKFQHQQMPLIFAHRAEELGIEVSVRKGLIELNHASFGVDPIFFQAIDGRRGAGFRMSEGSKFLAFVNPHAPDHLVACDSRLAVVAVCPFWARPSRNDLPAVAEMMGRQRVAENARHRDQDARHTFGFGFALRHAAALKEHNEAVISGKPVTAEDRAHARDLEERVETHGAAAAADIFSSPSIESGSPAGANEEDADDFLRAMATPSPEQ